MKTNKLLLIVGRWFLIIGLIILSLYALQIFGVFGGQTQAKTVEIKPGMGFDEIANQLKTENLIGSKLIFKIYSFLTGQSRQFKPGKYFLSGNLSLPQLVKILTDGPAEISVVITPGMTLKEIDGKLSNLNVIEPNTLINLKIGDLTRNYPWLSQAKSLEGFLLPDTYNFYTGSDANLVAQKLLDNLSAKALPFFDKSNNLVKVITLASLLEKEIPDYRESQLVAGILIKRLTAGVPLQVDATIIYAKCSGEFVNCPALQEKDYKINSPYNTYLYNGLPPGPICNPGPSAIKAVLNPQKSDYWYYLSDPKTQKTIFSKTLDEQNANRAKYLY